MSKSKSILTILLLLAFGLSCYGCAAKNNMLAEADQIKSICKKTRTKQQYVHEVGGPVCGIKELAKAESHRAFAIYEIENQSHYPSIRHHLDTGKENAELAYQKAKKCEPPDRDHDRVLDNVDACPDDPEDRDEWEDDDGCPDPDNDNDGILDTEDKCPDNPEDKDGFQDEDGCPDPDNDEDEVLDVDDRCPNDPEDKDDFQDEDGCPDMDNDEDGLPDEEDKCPNDPETYNGIDDEDGCPDQSNYDLINVTDTEIQLKQKIFFQTGKSRILPKSYRLLNEVAQAMKDYKRIKVRINGHTDSRGSNALNMKLSQARADSVRAYLIKQGVDPDRIKAKGYGETEPIASNRSSQGRAQNRRVEFKIPQKGESL